MDDIKIASGFEPADLQTAMNTLAATGYVPYGGLVVARDGQLAHAMINRAPASSTVTIFLIATAQRSDFQTTAVAQLALGRSPTGTPLIYRGTLICQVFYKISGVSEYASQILRVATTSGTQYVAAANTPQAIVWNAITEPSPDLATINLATGVLLFVNDFAGMITINARVQRNGALVSGASSWNIQVETSTNGTTWTPFPGSRRNISFNGAIANTTVNILVDGTFAIKIPAGTYLRITQYADVATPTVGIAGTAPAGGAFAEGYAAILSLMSTPNRIVV